MRISACRGFRHDPEPNVRRAAVCIEGQRAARRHPAFGHADDCAGSSCFAGCRFHSQHHDQSCCADGCDERRQAA